MIEVYIFNIMPYIVPYFQFGRSTIIEHGHNVCDTQYDSSYVAICDQTTVDSVKLVPLIKAAKSVLNKT